MATRNMYNGELTADIYAGGGMGRTPILGSLIKQNLPWQLLPSYLTALLRVYNRFGRRDNLYKARIKILVKALSPEEFARQVKVNGCTLKMVIITLLKQNGIVLLNTLLNLLIRAYRI